MIGVCLNLRWIAISLDTSRKGIAPMEGPLLSGYWQSKKTAICLDTSRKDSRQLGRDSARTIQRWYFDCAESAKGETRRGHEGQLAPIGHKGQNVKLLLNHSFMF